MTTIIDKPHGYQAVRLDFAYEESLATELEQYANQFGITSENIDILAEVSPSGGWPIVEFTGTPDQVEALLADYFASDPDSANA